MYIMYLTKYLGLASHLESMTTIAISIQKARPEMNESIKKNYET